MALVSFLHEQRSQLGIDVKQGRNEDFLHMIVLPRQIQQTLLPLNVT